MCFVSKRKCIVFLALFMFEGCLKPAKTKTLLSIPRHRLLHFVLFLTNQRIHQSHTRYLSTVTQSAGRLSSMTIGRLAIGSYDVTVLRCTTQRTWHKIKTETARRTTPLARLTELLERLACHQKVPGLSPRPRSFLFQWTSDVTVVIQWRPH